MATQRQISRGRTRHAIIGALARGDETNKAIADRFDVTPAAISKFADAHALEIANYQATLESGINAVWIADKESRLAEYADDVDQINAMFDEDVVTAIEQWIAAEDDPELRQAWGERIAQCALRDFGLFAHKHRALRNAAEEMGHLPSRTQVEHSGAVATYRVEGVDLGKLT